MTPPTTLAEALEMVPEYVMLKPGVDKWREGDEAIDCPSDELINPKYDSLWSKISWELIGTKQTNRMFHGELEYDVIIAGRRPIPQEVREAMAQNLMLEKHRRYAMTNAFEAWLLSQGGEP